MNDLVFRLLGGILIFSGISINAVSLRFNMQYYFINTVSYAILSSLIIGVK
jgi:hypothetical protein